jgi:hypothetical protein
MRGTPGALHSEVALMNSSGSTGHCGRMSGQSPLILMVGAAEAAPH